MNRFSTLLFITLIAILFVACEEPITPNITPQAELIFQVEDQSGQPVADAVVYLFPFKSFYEDYLSENPSGNDQITPSISSDNVGVTNSNGTVTFAPRDLEGNSYASGTTWIHRPNSIYFRVQGKDASNTFITNDDTEFKIEFDDIESGDFIQVETPVLVK